MLASPFDIQTQWHLTKKMSSFVIFYTDSIFVLRSHHFELTHLLKLSLWFLSNSVQYCPVNRVYPETLSPVNRVLEENVTICHFLYGCELYYIRSSIIILLYYPGKKVIYHYRIFVPIMIKISHQTQKDPLKKFSS